MDRFLIGQALIEDMAIVTADGAFSNYGVKVLW
jgi:PIN domain nuclease of toxin-antitoxin system